METTAEATEVALSPDAVRATALLESIASEDPCVLAHVKRIRAGNDPVDELCCAVRFLSLRARSAEGIARMFGAAIG